MREIELTDQRAVIREVETLATLEEALRGHDWHYAFADDPRIYRRGQVSIDSIRAMAKRLGPEGKALFRQHQSAAFKAAGLPLGDDP